MLKSLPAQISAITATVKPVVQPAKNIRFLLLFSLVLVLIVLIFTVLFHVIMDYEGQSYSWFSGLYWTMVTMSTLGFGDITFESDIGRLFSVVVLFSGMIFLLILMPFTFIEFFYSPFVKAQQEARAPRTVSPALRDHVILTHYDAVSATFIRHLDKQGVPYVLAVKTVEEGLLLHDAGVNVVVAELGDPESFARCGFARAEMIAATGDDFANTSVAFTARQLSDRAKIVTTADSIDSVDVMELAGSTHVMQLGEQLGTALARRTIATDAQTHLIGSFGELRIGEAMVAGTPLEGKTLEAARLREVAGVTVVGLWQRGVLIDPKPGVTLTADTMLLLAGTEEQMETYNALFCIYRRSHAPCVIIGAGRVGRAVAKNLEELDLEYRLIDTDGTRVHAQDEKHIQGNAADHSIIDRAGIYQAPAVIITTRQDDVNIYLTIYCRKLRPDIQILVRANVDANVARLHSAGADVVMSYASMGANILYNLLRNEDTLLVAEGLNVFRMEVPRPLQGRAIRDSAIRNQTGCTIIAVRKGETLMTNPEPDMVLDPGDELILIGNLAAEEKFFQLYRKGKKA